ncbi:MAG: ion channel [Candidatus Xenobiia bacterium LiM19]
MKNKSFFSLVFKENGYAVLLAFLLLMLCTYPMLILSPAGIILLDVLTSSVTIYGLWLAYSSRTYVIWPLAIIIFIGLVFDLFNIKGVPQVVMVATGIFEFIASLMVLVAVLIYVMREESVSFNQICGASSIYILFGAIWSILYFILEIRQSGAFRGIVHGHDTNFLHSIMNIYTDFLYYSYTVLTTVGFGDIIPVSQQARALTNVEAIIGQLFLAILIARLVGIHISQSSTGRN